MESAQSTPIKSELAKKSLIYAIAALLLYAIIAALTVLILGVFVGLVVGVVAIVTGHKARKEIRDSEVPMSGNGLAISGLILGYMVAIGLVGIVILTFTY